MWHRNTNSAYRYHNKFSALLICVLMLFSLSAQDKEKAARHFKYLNFHNSLSNLVAIDDDGVKIYPNATAKKSGKPEFTLYWPEVDYFVNMTKRQPVDSLVKVYNEKKNKRMGKYWSVILPELNSKQQGKRPLEGIKIAIDPGHIAGDFETGKLEQKFLEFRANDTTGLKEPVNITEGMLTWQTAMMLKNMLESDGAEVFVTRSKIENTSFGISYDEWLKTRKKKVLDSLRFSNKITSAEYKKYMNQDKKKFFWDFFRDHDLANRIKVINKFQPDLSVIIHYNVDEKNTDWLKPSNKDFTMCFIGGGMTADNFQKTTHKINFLRLLVSDDLDQSEKISGMLVEEFAKKLNVKVAKASDATYLAENCVASGTAGVYCRNLALCRGITSPLVYGESLYQDHFSECVLLNKCDKEFYGIKSNDRVKQVADSYFSAILNYYQN